MYHFVGNLLKVPFWDRVQKKRVLKMFFEKKSIRVARAALDGILLRYWRRNTSGSRDIEKVHARLNLELGHRLARKVGG